MDVNNVAKNWGERGFGCGLWSDPPGRVWKDYVHGTDELLMVVEGALEVEIEGRKHRAAPGEEIFIPAHALHTVRNTGGTTARWLYGYRHAGV